MVTTRKASADAAPKAIDTMNGKAAKGKGKGKAAQQAAKTSTTSKRARKSGESEGAESEIEEQRPAPKSKPSNKSAETPKMTKAKSSSKTGEASTNSISNEYSDSEEEEASDDDAILAGFSDVSHSGDEHGSSDDDEDDGGATKKPLISTSGVVKLPSSRDDAVVRQRLEKANKKRKDRGNEATPIVLYFGRVPKTMPEDSLRAYLTQFGDIRRLRLARNKRTGATKHYAFVEFADEDVGKIVCETMHNYLLEGRLLQVHVLPKEKVHPNLWIGANRKYRKVPGARRHRVLHDERPRSGEQKLKVERKLLARQDERRKKIKAQGIDYDFEGYA